MAKDKSPYLMAMKYASVGSQMIILIGGGGYGGYRLDQHWHTTPLFLILGPVLGLAISLYQLIRMLHEDK